MLIVIFHQVCLTRFYLGFYFLQYIRDVRAIRKHIWKYIETNSFLLILISTQSLIKFNDRPLWMTGLHFLFSYTQFYYPIKTILISQNLNTHVEIAAIKQNAINMFFDGKYYGTFLVQVKQNINLTLVCTSMQT